MKPEVKLIEYSPNPQAAICHAARVCYKSEDEADSYYEVSGIDGMKTGVVNIEIPKVVIKLGKNDEKLLRKLLTNNHSACLRFAYAHFHLTNISVATSRQLVRIAHAGILELSGRYVNQTGNSYVCPVEDEWFTEELAKLYKASDDFYKEAINRGFKKEEARYGKLMANTTELHYSGNFQMFKHLLSIRLNKKVMLETRMVCAEICKQLYSIAPIIFEEEYNKLDKIGL